MSEGLRCNHATLAAAEFANVNDRRRIIHMKSDRTDAKGDDLGRIGDNDRHDVRASLIDFGVDEAFRVHILTISRNRFAVEIAFVDVLRGNELRRNISRDKKMSGIRPAAVADVSVDVQYAEVFR